MITSHNAMSIMNLFTFLLLLIFFILRNSFTLIKGKRNRRQVTSFIYIGRKSIEIVVYFAIPILLLFDVINQKINVPLYWLGVLFSLFGLVLMAWARFTRDKDWGFMGDSSGPALFTGGSYRYTRHPYYMGALFIGVGIYMELNYNFVLLMLPVLFFVIHVIKKEEMFLEKQFGSPYVEYKKKVGIFPWLY
jgi:protein-S-isoprenylcysteine O-methyltransferase Ste14